MKSQQLSEGMTIALDGGIYEILSSVKVEPARGKPFIQTKLKVLKASKEGADTEKGVIEKSFQLDKEVEKIEPEIQDIEYLYPKENFCHFMNEDLDIIQIPAELIAEQLLFLRKEVSVKAKFFNGMPLSIELPQFLELMVIMIKEDKSDNIKKVSNATNTAILETRAEVQVPTFINANDIIKVDTTTREYVQRVN